MTKRCPVKIKWKPCGSTRFPDCEDIIGADFFGIQKEPKGWVVTYMGKDGNAHFVSEEVGFGYKDTVYFKSKDKAKKEAEKKLKEWRCR